MGAESTEVEEHGLVLAIQAAHYAERIRKASGDTSTRVGTPSGPGGGAGGKREERGSRNPLAIQTRILFTCWCIMQTGLEAILPLWLATSRDLG